MTASALPPLILSAFSNHNDRIPIRWEFSWEQFCDHLEKRDIRSEKNGPCFSPVSYREGATRGNAGVEAVTAGLFDFDHRIAPEPYEYEWQEKGWAYAVYSSFSHHPRCPKWRGVLPLAEPIPAAIASEVRQALLSEIASDNSDPTLDPARLFYWPSCPPETARHAFFRHQHGKPVDWRPIYEAWKAEQEKKKAKHAANDGAGARQSGQENGAARSRSAAYGDGLRITPEQMRAYGDIIAAFNTHADAHEILTSHGWTFVHQQSGEERWRRPGKSDGISGTFGYGGGRHFVCFTSSAPPLASNASYSLFDLTCVLDYGANVDACAKALAVQGYGAPEPENPDPGVSPHLTLAQVIQDNDWLLARRERLGPDPENEYVAKVCERAAKACKPGAAEEVVRLIYWGRAIKRRKEAFAWDEVRQFGRWYGAVQETERAHGAKPFIVAEAFRLPLVDENGNTSWALMNQMRKLQLWARIVERFGEVSEEVYPPRLFEALLPIRNALVVEHFLTEWREGRRAGIYDRIARHKKDEAAKRSAARQQRQAAKPPLHDREPADPGASTPHAARCATAEGTSSPADFPSPLPPAILDAVRELVKRDGPEATLLMLQERLAETRAGNACEKDVDINLKTSRQKPRTCVVFDSESEESAAASPPESPLQSPSETATQTAWTENIYANLIALAERGELPTGPVQVAPHITALDLNVAVLKARDFHDEYTLALCLAAVQKVPPEPPPTPPASLRHERPVGGGREVNISCSP